MLFSSRVLLRTGLLLAAVLSVLPLVARAHDTWVQANTNLVKTGNGLFIDLMLGNHGNHHRDFKIASKLDLAGVVLQVHAPDQKTYDLKPDLADIGYAPKEGFWSTRFVPAEPGLYMVEQTLDKVVNHGQPVRSIRSAKTFFVVTPSLDNVPRKNPGFDRVLGHPLELVPVYNPVTPMGPGETMKLQVLLHGKPLEGARVSFIPRGVTLEEEFDAEYERLADAEGVAKFVPKSGNYYLVVVHHADPSAIGEGYNSTAYSATLTVFVPDVCPCCGE